MAIYHLNARNVSRTKGQSAVAKAKYIQRLEPYAQQEDGVIFAESGHMPEWAGANGLEYWEGADRYERSNARLGKELEIALPKELAREDQIALAQSFAHHLTDAERLPYTMAVHGGKGRNPHAHIFISERGNDGLARSKEQYFRRFNGRSPEAGGARKTTSLRKQAWLEDARSSWATQANAFLERTGSAERIDHRSYQAQGRLIVPSQHLGPQAFAMVQRGVATDRSEAYRQRMAERVALDQERGALRKDVQRYQGQVRDKALEQLVDRGLE